MGELDRGAHHFSEVFYREIPLLARFNAYPQTEIATSRAPAGTDGRWTLGWNGKGFDFSMSDSAQGTAFDLSTIPNRPLVLEGPNGYSAKNAAGSAASLYYSFPRMDTRGTLRVGGKTWKVRGDTWMDREFTSSSLGSGQVGWDWMGLRLEDGRDLMLYILRRSDGQVDFRNATLVDAAGRPRYLDPSQWSVHVLDTWKSPNTQAVYPSRWLVVVPQEGLRLEVVPEMPDQENRSRLLNNLYYWEGAARVRAPVGAGTDRPAGRTVGGGYVELTGYGKGSRVPR